MNSAPTSSDDSFLQLLVRWQDGSLTEAETALLEQEMMASEEKRRMFAQMQMRSMLLNELMRREAYGAGRSFPFPSFRFQKKLSYRFRWALGAVAAVLAVVGVCAWWMYQSPRHKGAAPGLAAVTYDHVAEWEDGGGPVEGQFAAGSYVLASGTVRMALSHDGTVATLAGPARFDIVAPGNIRLHEGRLSAHVFQPEAGFTVLTDALTVHDRGTVFGVDVRRDGEALVSVVEGKVDVQPHGSTVMQRIEQGGTVVAHPRRPQLTPPPSDAVSGFEDLWPLTMGVDDLSNLVEFVVPRKKHRWNDYRSDSRLFLMAERQHVRPESVLTVDILPGVPQEKKKRDSAGHPLSRNARVNSYLLFFRPGETPAARPADISGSITFAHPVLGIISDSARLEATDDILGHPRITYVDKPRRGIEKWKKPEERDVVRISRDGRRVYFNLHATGDPDEFRVLVAAP